MTRDLPKLLALADERIARSDVFLHTQRNLIETLRRLGHDTTNTDAGLREYEGMHAEFIADRDRLREELQEAT